MENQVVSLEQVQLPALAQKPVSQIVFLLPAISSQLQITGAQNMAEAAIPSTIEAMRKAMSDPALRGLNYEGQTASQIIFGIATKGSVAQRRAMASHLSPAAAYFFPSIYAMGQKSEESFTTVLQLLQTMLQVTADHYGVQVSGDVESLAHTIFQDYGGLTVADLLIFFERAKSGRYREEYQHIAVRGINWDFLKSWLDKYVTESEDARRENYAKFVSPNTSIHKDVAVAMNIKRVDPEERRRLEMEADAIRNEWERTIYTTQIIQQWFAEVEIEENVTDEFGQIVYEQDGTSKKRKFKKEILCDEKHTARKYSREYPTQVFTPTGLEKAMKRLIYEYVTFHNSQETIDTYQRLVGHISKKYDDGTHHLVEMKCNLAAISALPKNWSAHNILFAEIKRTHPAAEPEQINAKVLSMLNEYENLYYTDYLPSCIETKYPPLRQREMIWQSVLREHVNAGGSNPVTKVLFD